MTSRTAQWQMIHPLAVGFKGTVARAVARTAPALSKRAPVARPITPGARPPRYHWLTWGPVVLVALWIAATIRLIDVPLLPIVVAFLA